MFLSLGEPLTEGLSAAVEFVSRLSTPAIVQRGESIFPNRAALRLLGCTGESDAASGDVMQRIIVALARARAESSLDLREPDGQTSVVLPLRKADGRDILVRLTYELISEDGDGFWLLHDISQDLVETVRELRASEARWRALAESVPGYIVEVSPEGFVRWISRAPRGGRLADLVGRDALDLLTADTRDRVLEWIQETLVDGPGGEQSLTFETEEVLPNGDKVYLRHTMVPLIVGGVHERFFAYVNDITDFHRREQELEEAVDRLNRSLRGAVLAVASALEKRDPYTAGHSVRVAELAAALASEIGRPDLADRLGLVGSVHDIGKISVPAEILAKPSSLAPAEFALIKTHPETGYEILRNIDFGWPAADIVLQHHERLDGSGYPRGLKGAEICLEARIIAVADVVEAMSSHRPYRPALGISAALEEISANKDRLYDGSVVAACIRIFERGFRFPDLELPPDS